MTRRRFLSLFFLLCATFLIIMGRLIYLQIFKRDYYRELSRKNYLRLKRLYAPRGDILDRNGEKMAYDVPRYSLFIDPEKIKDREELERISRYIKVLFKVDINEMIKKGDLDPLEPLKIKDNLTQDELERFYNNSFKLPGVFVNTIPHREYPYKETMAHVVGYVGLPDSGDFRKYGDKIGPNSLVGKYGIEKAMDDILLGEIGGEEIIVNAIGKPVKLNKRKNPVKGNTIVLTIDIRVQQIIRDVLEESGYRAGAAIVLKAKTGEVLGMYSMPSFDPNKVYKNWKKLVRSKLKPFFNRVTMAKYPPASVVKVPLAFAFLDTKIARYSEVIKCTGRYRIGNRVFYCWKRVGHGDEDIVGAIRDSCDVYFYQKGYKLGPRKMTYYLRRFCYGEDIPFELKINKGLVPTPSWKLKKKGELWYDGDTLNLSIGQGFMLSTLMEQTLMMMGIANNGVIYRPTLIREIRDNKNRVIWKNKRKVFRAIKGRLEYFAIIKRSLREVVRRGTGRAAFSKIVDIAGKTGTAQVAAIRTRERKKVPWRLRDHAWFVGFAPYRDPLFIVGVVIEHGGSGGTAAAPIARKILERIYITGIKSEI